MKTINEIISEVDDETMAVTIIDTVFTTLTKLPDEKVDMFLNYLKYLSTIKE